VPGGDGVVHCVEVTGTSVFEVAAAGIAQMREEGLMEPLVPTAMIRVEVQLAPVVHELPLKALQRWANGPSVSPKQELLKRPLRAPGR
jgi:hypothetical protein